MPTTLTRWSVLLFLCCRSLTLIGQGPASSFSDQAFPQPIATTHDLPEGVDASQVKRLLVDRYNILYLLAEDDLYRLLDGQVVRDRLYRPLQNRVPVDMATQAETGYLYYLYEDEWLTNAYAGAPGAKLPEGTFSQLAVNETGEVLVLGKTKAALWKGDHWQGLKAPPQEEIAVLASGEHFFLRSTHAIYQLLGEGWQLIHEAAMPLTAWAVRKNELILGTAAGYYGWDWRKQRESFALQTNVPVPQLTDLLVHQGQAWAATPQGIFSSTSDGTYRYFASQRWLPDDQVLQLAADSKGSLYALTPAGLGQIAFPEMSLAEKTALFERNIQQYHLRYGFIANLRLKVAGDLSSAEMIDTDNDGLWTAFWLGSQAFRYASTGEEIARQHVWEAFEAYERLLSINQLTGFPSRTFERKGFKVSDPDRWRDSPETDWEWKGHTSSDEFVGYLFIVSVMDQLVVQTEGERQRITAFFDAIMTHILDHDWTLVDVDGKPTLWARWNPEFVNGYAPTVFDRRLNSANILAGLQLAYGLTGKERYREAAYELLDTHGYRENLQIPMKEIRYTEHHYGKVLMGTDWNHSDDEMAFLLYWPLYHYALEENLTAIYAEMIRNHWEIELPERNALWHTLTYGTIGKIKAEDVAWHLREYPLDLIRYDMHNSHRKDLTFLPENFRRQTTKRLLSPAERPMQRHNANPFRLDGGQGGKTKLAGDEYLLPYWMGRYLGVIGE